MRWLLSNKLKEERGRDTEDVLGRALQADGKINTRLLDKKMMYMCHCNKQRGGRDFGRKLRRHGRNWRESEGRTMQIQYSYIKFSKN